jgi:hypothetical protein
MIPMQMDGSQTSADSFQSQMNLVTAIAKCESERKLLADSWPKNAK